MKCAQHQQIRLFVTRSQSPPKSFHVHPQRFRQRVILTDGAQIEWSCICPTTEVLKLVQDSANHPSWNSSKLNNQRILLDSFGSISKFHKKISAKEAASSTAQAPAASDGSAVWDNLEKSFTEISQMDISSLSPTTKTGRLEREALMDPEKKTLAAISTSRAKTRKK